MLKSAPKAFVVAICGYEVLAVTTGRTPTVTALCGRYRLLGPGLVLALAVHLFRSRPVTVQVVVADECPVCPVAF